MIANLRSQSPINVYVFPFEKLDVWQIAIDLADNVLELLEKISYNKQMRLVSQMEGAVTSVAQNIAEGKGRQYKKELMKDMKKNKAIKILPSASNLTCKFWRIYA